MADNVWLIGAAMTKFGRYPEQDVVDLASDAALDAMTDAGATIHDMNVMAVGSQFEMFTLGQRIQKQIGQTGIPVYNVSNACATGASAVRTVIMAIKAGEADMGLAIGAEQMGKAGLLGSAGQARDKKNVYEPSGRYGSVMPGEGVLGTGVTPRRMAADQAYEQSGVDPQDLDLVELHDCFATAELIHYDNLRLCEPGGAGDFIDSGAPRRDGRIPVNVSGGLISKGHPIGATGAANIYEVAAHLRGEAGDRQIEGATVGLTHVIGLGSACAVHILEKQAS